MATTESGPVLVALELDDSDDDLITLAAAHARAVSARLYLIHVVPLPDDEFVGMPKEVDAPAPAAEPAVGYAYDRDRAAERLRDERTDLHMRCHELKRQGLDVTALQAAGSPGDKIVAEARRLGAGLIVAGHRRRTMLGEIVFGSTSKEILSDAPCPVLLVPQA